MSAGIEKRDTQVGIEMGWHRLTKVVESITRENCGIVYPMEIQRLVLPNGNQTDYHCCVSTDDGLPIGGTVTDGYKLFSNEQMFDMVQRSLGGTTNQIVSVGSVNNREKVFCSVKLSKENIKAGGRVTEDVLNILWGHGGKFSIMARSGLTVVLCKNTWNITMARKGEFELRLKHTGNADLKIENMGRAIDAHFGVVAEFKRAMDGLEEQSCNEDTAREIYAGFLVREENPEEVSTRAINTIDRLTSLYKGGAGNRGENMCDVFNGFTDYYTHESSGGNNRWKQFESSEFGAGNNRKTEAYQLLTGQTVKGLGDLAATQARGNKVLQLV